MPQHVRLARGVFQRDSGRVLLGGYPARIMRLSATGAEVVRGWQAGAVVNSEPASSELAERLLAARILVPTPRARPVEPGLVEVVVPVFGPPRSFGDCLTALAKCGQPITVVDDGSPDPNRVREIASGAGARVLRLETNRGPAAARNFGAKMTSAPLIAFVDADVVVTPGWLEQLIPHFDAQTVALVGPRVGAFAQTGDRRLAGYEARHSSLDMGADGGFVGVGMPISYLPATALIVRRTAYGTGFDERLEVGEDVDFCWRVGVAGHDVIYEPRALVQHDHRTTWPAFLRRRWQYAESVAPLSQLHPDALPAMRANPLIFAALGLLAAGRITPAVGLLATAAARLNRQVHDPKLSLELTGWTTAMIFRGTSRAALRNWLPALLALAIHSRYTRRVLLIATVERAIELGLDSDLDIALLDDAIAAFGATYGSLRHRTWRPLKVDFTSI